jgi:hypothetical protein
MKRHVANREIYIVQIEKKMDCQDEPLEGRLARDEEERNHNEMNLLAED